MAYKILVADDEARIRSIIKKYAEFEGHEVTEAEDGIAAIRFCKSQEFDIIIVDIMMPELDGFSTCREIRKFSDEPIIMLSARGEEYDRINAFDIGVDDYVMKPFSPKELMLRIEAILRRIKPKVKDDNTGHNVVFSFDDGKFQADITARLVYIDGQRVDLSPKEYDLLFYMLKNQNIALYREQILNEVWGYNSCGDARTLDTHIKLLRRSLGRYEYAIVTLRGVGYRFELK